MSIKMRRCESDNIGRYIKKIIKVRNYITEICGRLLYDW